MADTTCVALRSKIRSEHMSLSLIQILCDDFLWSIGVLCGRFSGFMIGRAYQFVRCDDRILLREKIKRKSEQHGGKGKRGGGPSIDYIYKEPDRLLHGAT